MIIRLTVVCFICMARFAGADNILYGSFPADRPPDTVWFVSWEDPTTPIKTAAAYSFSEGKLAAAALVKDETETRGRAISACLAVENTSSTQAYCSGVKVYPNMKNGRKSIDMMHDAESALSEETRNLRQEVLDTEMELRDAREKAGSLIHVESLAALRSRRIAADETLLSLTQERQTLERSLREIKELKPTENARLVARSLEAALNNIQRVRISSIR